MNRESKTFYFFVFQSVSRADMANTAKMNAPLLIFTIWTTERGMRLVCSAMVYCFEKITILYD
jgi:hypothetical protein